MSDIERDSSNVDDICGRCTMSAIEAQVRRNPSRGSLHGPTDTSHLQKL